MFELIAKRAIDYYHISVTISMNNLSKPSLPVKQLNRIAYEIIITLIWVLIEISL